MTETTAQGLFDAVAAHLRTQKGQSMVMKKYAETERGTSVCLYRGPNGLKCAVGAIITDEEYTPKMDDCDSGQSVYELINANLFPVRLIPFASLLSELQSVHDNDCSWDENGFTEEGEEWLARAAEANNLIYTPA